MHLIQYIYQKETLGSRTNWEYEALVCFGKDLIQKVGVSTFPTSNGDYSSQFISHPWDYYALLLMNKNDKSIDNK